MENNLKEFKFDYARIEYLEEKTVYAEDLETAKEIFYEMLANGECYTNETKEHYIKIYDEEENLICDTEEYNGWGISDIENAIEDLIFHFENEDALYKESYTESYTKIMLKLKDLTSADKQNIFKLFIQKLQELDFNVDCEGGNNLAEACIEEYVGELVLKVSPLKEDIPEEKWGVHVNHCCKKHGCKYGYEKCPVVIGLVEQKTACIDCEEQNG